jgi:hypothetical protein
MKIVYHELHMGGIPILTKDCPAGRNVLRIHAPENPDK